MRVGNSERRGGFGDFIVDYRLPIAAILIATTVVLAYWAVRVPIATRFENLFPANHPNTVLYRKYRRQYGSALTLALLLRVERGDIFNYKTLQTIQEINHEVDILDGVNHNEVFSLASYRVFYATASPGTITIAPFMYPKIPANQAELTALSNNVRAHQNSLAGIVTSDFKGALIIASFNEGRLDYGALFDAVQKIIVKHQDANTKIYASGPVMFYAWGYHYLPRLRNIFLISVALMVLLTLLVLRARTGWWAPLVIAAGALLWGFGFMSLMGYTFDPVMLVVPLVLTARDLAHGIQWQGRYHRELAASDNHILACAATANAMLWPGVLAVLANIAGVVFVTISDIPVLKQIGWSGAVWLGAGLVLVFVGQPVLVSFLPAQHGAAEESGRVRGAGYLESAALRAALIAGGVAAIVIGFISYGHVMIGYQTAGTPLYRASAKVNRDTAEISRYVPTNTGWVVLDTPEYPSPESGYGTENLRMVDDMANYLLERGDVSAVIGLYGMVEKPMDQLFHNSAPKYFTIPDTTNLSTALFFFFVQSATPDEVTSYFQNLMSARNSCVRLLMPDHTAARLTRVRDDLDNFMRARVANDPSLSGVKLHYIGGDAGLYQAADDVMAGVNRRNLILVFAAIFILGAIFFRSPLAGALLVLTGLMANLLAFTYMNFEGMGLTVDTVSVISLGIGLGISYALYMLWAIREESARGAPLPRAIGQAISHSGWIIIGGFIVLVAGLAPWVFSPVLFQTAMSTLLILLMATNLIAGLLILPALLLVLRPRFLMRAAVEGSSLGATPRAQSAR